MKEIKLTDLLEAGCHFGHQTTRWNPKMKPYIYTARDRIHIFDLVMTKKCLEEAGEFLSGLAKEGKQIIFVGTKRQSQELVVNVASRLGLPYVTERWMGGLITNWPEVGRRVKKLVDWTAKRESNFFTDRTKRELVLIDREIAKLRRHFGGVIALTDIPSAIVVTDAHKNVSALLEAKKAGVKVIAITDTNANPDLVDYPIPANDDAVKSVELILNYLAEAIEEGRGGKAHKPETESTEKSGSQGTHKTKDEGTEESAVKAGKVENKKAELQKTPRPSRTRLGQTRLRQKKTEGTEKELTRSVKASNKKTGTQKRRSEIKTQRGAKNE